MRYYSPDGTMRFVTAKSVTRPTTAECALAPDARWVAPSAADKALARAVVAAADARIAAEVSEAESARNLADYQAREVLDAVSEPRDWLRVVGTLMCLAPLVVLVLYIVGVYL